MAREAALRGVPSTFEALARVVVCALDPQQRARFADAFRGHAVLHVVESLAELETLFRAQADDIDTVILPLRDRDNAAAELLVREIIVGRPKIAIVAYCGAVTEQSRDIRTLAVAGVHQIVFRGADDGGAAVRRIVAAARRQCAAGWVLRQLTAVVPPSLHLIVEAAVARPEITSVALLASAMGLHRKTLLNRCEAGSCVSPAELLSWCRLALVAHYLETTPCTIEMIGLELSYPSDTALRNSMKRYTGMRATEIRAHGGIAAVVDALRRRLDARKMLRPLAPRVTLTVEHKI